MTTPTDGLRLDLDALAERLRGEANFILGDAAAWGVDTYGDQPRTVKLLLEAADAIDMARRTVPSEKTEPVAYMDNGFPYHPVCFPKSWRDEPQKHGLTPLIPLDPGEPK